MGKDREQSGKGATPAGRKPSRVAIVVFPGVNLLDVAGPGEVFAALAEARGLDRAESDYSVELVSSARELRVKTSSGVTLAADGHVFAVRGEIDTLLVPGGTGVWEAAGDRAFIDQLRRVVPRARRVASVCTGAFLLAASGVLDGRRATTHWRWCDRLAGEHPEVEVEPDAIFVRDGEVYTSAGVTTGMDLALALVEDDLGREAALAIARHLVLFVRRPGGQSQFSPLLEMQAADRRPLRDLQAWIVDHLAEDLSVEALAGRAHMSARNFARAFHKEVGSTPARFVERLRVDAVRRRLEETDAGLERIARECGFGGPDSMRRSFLRVLRVAPGDYRDRFRVAPRA
ncbi:MAG: GlxA family transcriptional regulator [Paludisphaera borealis]|uniref:GlxA family transcriptional regulator n=1 Tax=Paludisphaera borealis TaxID=1387353 RepID=UPI00283F11EF|nr:GlxA family transcriptional regulator [Paludisphaera borealis]MDR3623364.1 GlxA family transcriptional regulator [Paludisphaera borealis]